MTNSPKNRPEPRKCIQDLKEYVPGRTLRDVREKYGLNEAIKLSSNENPFGPPPKARLKLKSLASEASLYPDGSATELRNYLAALHEVSAKNILVGNGSDEVFNMVAGAFIHPRDQVLISRHTFSQYEFSTRLFDGKPVFIPLNNMTYDLESFGNSINENVRMIFLCNPNNPTGTYFNHQSLHRFLNTIPKSVLVIIDEAYSEFATASDFPKSIHLVKRFPNLIVSRTLSKAYGLAGMRIGYAIANQHVLTQCLKVKSPFNVNLLAQAVSISAIDDKPFLQATLRNNARESLKLQNFFTDSGIEYLPSQANFICFKSPVPAKKLAEKLMQKGVIIRALTSFDLPFWCRVSIGRPKQMVRFKKALTETLSCF